MFTDKKFKTVNIIGFLTAATCSSSF